jgi:Cu+-exporting ATPase
LQVGDRVAAGLGEALACDGVVCAGPGALLDQSQVTGESAPVRKGEGEFVIAGSIIRDIIPPSPACADACAPPYALTGTRRLVVEATRVGKDSFIQQLVMLVERAQASKAPIQVRPKP